MCNQITIQMLLPIRVRFQKRPHEGLKIGDGHDRYYFLANSVYSHDRPQEYPFGKPDLRVPEIPRPDKEFRKACAGIRFPNPGLPGRTFPPGYPSREPGIRVWVLGAWPHRQRAHLQKTVLQNNFCLTKCRQIVFLNNMSTTETQKKCRWCWRKDLAAFRGLTDRERTGFLLVLEWFEN